LTVTYERPSFDPRHGSVAAGTPGSFRFGGNTMQRIDTRRQRRAGRIARPRDLAVRAGALAAAGLLLAACGGGGTAAPKGAPGAKVQGGVVTDANVAEPPNYIFPIETANYNTSPNVEMSGLLWKGLYQFAPVQPVLDYGQSIGNKPVFSDGGKTITITMKHYKWSDGKPVTARDVQFGLDIIRAVGPLWDGFVAGGFPSNVKSFQVLGTYEFRLQLTRSFASTWFDDNQLPDLIPLPQQAWDKTSAAGAVGNYDLTTSGAKKVYAFLNKQAAQTSSYASNPLWKVVDGAWKLSSFGGASSPTIFVPNTAFSGHHAIISKFEMAPYTSSSAEFNALRSGPNALTIGGMPTNDIPDVRSVEAAGYTSYKVFSYHVNYVVINFTNPKLGKLFDQLYIRQALQHLIDQPTDIKAFQSGLGAPIYGPTPPYPRNSPFTSSEERTNPYPYSVAAATSLLKAHGWAIHPAGTDVCTKGGAGGCGAGVATGMKLSIPMTVASGQPLTDETRNFASDAAKAGVDIGLDLVPFNTSIAIMNPCKKGNAASPTCKWGLGTYGGDAESVFPNSTKFFVPNGSDNSGGYDNPALNQLIAKIHYSNSLANYHKVANFGATQLPLLWFPDASDVSLLEVDSHLHTLPGSSPFNAEFGSFTPENWYFTKG
jgi:peptide/nickel transport system substrate-binding protein